MLKFVLPLAILPLLGLSLSQPAAAQPYWWQAPGGDYDQSYDSDGPYGPDPNPTRADRFDDDQYRAYRREMWRRYHRNNYGYGNDYPPQDTGYGDDPQAVPYAAPVYPTQSQAQGKVLVAPGGKPVAVKKKVVPPKPATTTATTAPATTTSPATATASSTTTETASTAPSTTPVTATPPAATTTSSAASTDKSSTAAATKKGGPVTCDKGASIVTSFGFEKVTNKTCDGPSLVYSAERGGKPFEIEVNPKSGELTAVKKL